MFLLTILGPPTAIQNLMVTFTTSTSVNLAWDPANSGGRDDLVYIIYFREEGSNDLIQAATVDTSRTTISGECHHKTKDLATTLL